MLIDAFSSGLFEQIDACTRNLNAQRHLHLLIDGAFSPGLHGAIEENRKALLFSLRPGCSEEAKDVSPFVTPFDPVSKKLRMLWDRCNRWPMLSVIETPETFDQLAARLAAWCVVEADGQRFNFRFADTRRLPAIFHILSPRQRGEFAGPATRWLYVNRYGQWDELQGDCRGGSGAVGPVLDERQFACLVDDSKADELLVLLRDRGHDVFGVPSRSHTLLTIALGAALKGKLADEDLLRWCEWFWKQDELHDDGVAIELLQSWRTGS